MPTPLPTPLRSALFRLWQAGRPVADLAEQFGLCPRTVRHLVQRFQRRGAEGVAPSYARPGAEPPDPLRQLALALRSQHPSWGAGLIRVFLGRGYPPQSVPTERTLQRWFHAAGLGPAPKGRRPQTAAPRADGPHAVWQMDAKERVPLRGGERVSWLRFVEEYCGAVLKTRVFPPGELVPGAGRGGARRHA